MLFIGWTKILKLKLVGFSHLYFILKLKMIDSVSANVQEKIKLTDNVKDEVNNFNRFIILYFSLISFVKSIFLIQ